jgi:flagellar motility protein MotE (MotC chaperone)
MPRRVRLLPAVIFAAALLFTLKVGGLWQNVQLEVQASAAAEEGSAKGKPGGDAKPAAEAAGQRAAEAKSETAGKAGADKPAKPDADDEKRKSGQAMGEFDPLTATDAEIELLGKLAKRREELERRSSELDLRENLLKATERRLDEKVAELKSIKATIEELLKKHEAENEAKLKSLVKIYENMKPKDAARIFEKLDLPILLDVVERMREAKTAPILADMEPAKAKTVTAALAERRSLPKPQTAEADPGAPLRPN